MMMTGYIPAKTLSGRMGGKEANFRTQRIQ
jgi:hypothetical protein